MTTEKYISHTILSVIMLLTGNACSRFEVETASPAGRDIPISFSASVDDARSKSIFTPENFSRPGHEIAVLDILDDGTFHIGDDESGEVAPATYTCQDPSSPYWSDDDGQTYYWTQGVHNFFAYATKFAQSEDKNIKDKNNSLNTDIITFIENKSKLSVGPWALSLDNQFDFIYARHRRDMSQPDPYRDVKLSFEHMFAAVGIEFSYISSTDKAPKMYFIDWYFTGLKTSGTAVIPIEGDGAPEITLSEAASEDKQFEEVDSNGYIQKDNIQTGESLLPYRGRKGVGDSGHFVIWPQTFNDLSEVQFHFRYTLTDLEDIQKNWKETDLNSQADNLDIKECWLQIGGEERDFDIDDWEAGKKYMYHITVSDNIIYCDVKITPWIDDEVILDEK